jgi:hypothetical protein
MESKKPLLFREGNFSTAFNLNYRFWLSFINNKRTIVIIYGATGKFVGEKFLSAGMPHPEAPGHISTSGTML